MSDGTALPPEDDAAARAAEAALPDLRRLECYWDELRAGRRVPQRRDVDPGRLEGLLPHAFLMQRVAPGVGRIRVAGQNLTRLFGMDPRGMPLSAFFGVDARETLGERLCDLFDGPSVVELPVASRRGLGRPRLSGRLMMLPLIGDDGLVSACLGALAVAGSPGAAPRRFDIAAGRIRCDLVLTPRPRTRRSDPPDLGEALAALRRRHLSERAAPGAPDPDAAVPRRGAAAPPYLRLVVDNG